MASSEPSDHGAMERLALVPYLAAFYPFLVVRRAGAEAPFFGKGPWRTWVTPSIQVGGFLYPWDIDVLAREGIGAILNVTRELVEPVRRIRERGLRYLRIPCWDGRVPSIEDARVGVDFMAAQIAEGRKVYVHCASGVGRSVSLVLCYVCEREGKDVEEALAALRGDRPRVSLSRAQRGFIDAFLASSPAATQQRPHVEQA